MARYGPKRCRNRHALRLAPGTQPEAVQSSPLAFSAVMVVDGDVGSGFGLAMILHIVLLDNA